MLNRSCSVFLALISLCPISSALTRICTSCLGGLQQVCHLLWHLLCHLLCHLLWHLLCHLLCHLLWHLLCDLVCHLLCDLVCHLLWHLLCDLLCHLLWHLLSHRCRTDVMHVAQIHQAQVSSWRHIRHRRHRNNRRHSSLEGRRAVSVP